MGNQGPVAKYRHGSVSVSKWANEGEKDGNKFQFMTFSVQRSFQKDDTWVNAPSKEHPTLNLRVNDIPKLIAALQEAYNEETRVVDKTTE